MRGLSDIEIHTDRVVLRTPSEPNFWFGNMVIFRAPVIDHSVQIAQFRVDFPQAEHVVIGWDTPGPENEGGLQGFVDAGFTVDRSDVLSLTKSLNRHMPPEGIEIRPIRTDDDWEQVIALQHEVGIEQEYGGEGHENYVRGRFTNRRMQTEEGWGCWFGAFDGPLLAGDLGIFLDNGVARYQSVETRKSHRGRGICPALVTAAADWVTRTDPEAVPVIIADTDGRPGRIYRDCGFTLDEVTLAVWRRPDRWRET